MRGLLSFSLAACLLAGCQVAPGKPDAVAVAPEPVGQTATLTAAPPVTDQTVATPTTPATRPMAEIKTPPIMHDWLKAAAWSELPGWMSDDLGEAWPALLQSCAALQRQSAWREVCADAGPLANTDTDRIRAFVRDRFSVYRIQQADGGDDGLVTGYYEPLLQGSRAWTPKFRYPLYAPPDDLLVVDLSTPYPELKGLRLRGRLDGNRVVPYFTRGEIEAGKAPVHGREIAWVENPLELFFLQVQGSGRIQLESGDTMRVGYADQNGHPYRSIGKWLVERGELTLDRASMQGIKDWARDNPERLPELLAANPSYVFFRELPDQEGGPIGALGVPLTPERSIAVDPRAIPLGAPVWLASTRPNSSEILNRLVLAQDTGSAIRGNVRADFFWGFGDKAGALAGAMKQKGRMWLLLPKDYPVGPHGSNGKSGL